jgi:hypothetical protein
MNDLKQVIHTDSFPPDGCTSPLGARKVNRPMFSLPCKTQGGAMGGTSLGSLTAVVEAAFDFLNGDRVFQQHRGSDLFADSVGIEHAILDELAPLVMV